jgi:hypothetical protein
MFTGQQQRNKQTSFPIARRQIGREFNEISRFSAAC